MLYITNLTYAYPDTDRPALSGISFTVERGQVLLVAGGTGAGKSTLCYALAGFVPHFFNGTLEGDIALGEQYMRSAVLGEWVKRVGLVLQNPFNQISGARATVFEEVAFGLENLGIPRAEMGQRVGEVLEQLEIAHLAERSPYALSGGQQQRVAIASVLAMQPEVLVLDEPTAQLDPDGTAEVFEVVRTLAQRGTTVVIATHQLAEVAPFVTHALVLHQGAVVRMGVADEILRDVTLATYGVEPPLYASLGTAVGRNPPPLSAKEFRVVRNTTDATITPPAYYPFTLPTVEVETVAPMPVAVEGLTFAYPSGVRALEGVSGTFTPGTITAIIGANGAGKSTLARTLNGLLRPQQGMIQIGDMNTATRKAHEVARRVGYLFQNPDDQLFKPTVQQEVAFAPTNFYGKDNAKVTQAVARALALTHLTDAADSHPYDLHPIQRRWVALAGVLAGGAPVLILDEPTSGFDLVDKTRLTGLCMGLRAAGYTLIVVSHDMQLVAELADTVVVMNAGRVVAHATPGAVFGDAALMSQIDGILPPVAQVAQAVGLSPDIVRVRDFLAVVNDTSPHPQSTSDNL
jgi:energy-coupling factor transporter ATP-binding protein EcfA2